MLWSIVISPIAMSEAMSGGGNFDHDAFYKWAAAAPWPVYISEYAMPDDFECIASRDSLSTLSSINNSKRVTEKIFLHRKWITTARPNI